MPFRHLLCACLCCFCLGCDQTPVLPGTLTAADRAAPFPVLLPKDALFQGQPAAPAVTQAANDTYNRRLANLRARATALSGPVIPASTRARMQAAIARAALR